MLDDSELLRAYADSSSEEAFAELVRRHIGSVYAVALRRVGGDRHLADDVTQEVFTDLAGKASSLSRREVLAGWLFVAARYASAKAVRRDQQRHSLLRKVQLMIDEEQMPGAETDWEKIRPLLDDAIFELNERDRDAILYYYFDKRTYAEIGARLLLTESGARMRVERGLEKMRLFLSRRGITSTTAALGAALGGQAAAAVPGSLLTSVTTGALAGTVQSGGAVFLTLMKITKTQVGAAIAVILAGVTLVEVRQQSAITTLRSERTQFETASAASRGHERELAGKIARDGAIIAGLKGQIEKLQAAKGVSPGGAEADAKFEVRVVRIADIVRDHPEYAALERKAQRRMVARQYDGAIAALGLPPDKVAQLKDLLVEKSVSSMEAFGAATDAGIPNGSGDFNKAVAAATADTDQAIVSLIGKDANEKLDALKGTQSFAAENDVGEYALEMADAGIPISTDQSQQLAQILHGLADPIKNPDSAAPDYKKVDQTTWLSPLDQQFLDKASGILTSTQVRLLGDTRSEFNQRNTIIEQYRGGPNVPLMIRY